MDYFPRKTHLLLYHLLPKDTHQIPKYSKPTTLNLGDQKGYLPYLDLHSALNTTPSSNPPPRPTTHKIAHHRPRMCTERHKRWKCGCTEYIETISHCAILIPDSCAFHSVKHYVDQTFLCNKCTAAAEALLRRVRKGQARLLAEMAGFNVNVYGSGKGK